MITSNTMYDFKMFITINDKKLLTFRAWVVDKKTYYLQEVPHFGIHENDKKIFLSILDNTLEIDEYEVEKRESIVHNRKPKDSDDIYTLLDEAGKFLKTYLDVESTFESIELSPMVDFRFDGSSLNIGYGLEFNSANKIHLATDSIMEALASNNTKFKGITQSLPRAGSTVIPYLCEEIDVVALDILKDVIGDINHKKVSQSFEGKVKNYIDLYTKLVKKFKALKQVPDLDIFQVIIQNEVHEINDMSLIDDAQKQLIGKSVEDLKVLVHIPAYSMRGTPRFYSASVVLDEMTYKIHLDVSHKDFDNMRQVLKDNEGKYVIVSGYKTGEQTILASKVVKFL